MKVAIILTIAMLLGGCVNWPISCPGADEILDYIKTSTSYVYYCRLSDEKRDERLRAYYEKKDDALHPVKPTDRTSVRNRSRRRSIGSSNSSIPIIATPKENPHESNSKYKS